MYHCLIAYYINKWVNDIHSAQALPSNLNGLVHLDEALKGKFTKIRQSGRFKEYSLEPVFIKYNIYEKLRN